MSSKWVRLFFDHYSLLKPQVVMVADAVSAEAEMAVIIINRTTWFFFHHGNRCLYWCMQIFLPRGPLEQRSTLVCMCNIILCFTLSRTSIANVTKRNPIISFWISKSGTRCEDVFVSHEDGQMFPIHVEIQGVIRKQQWCCVVNLRFSLDTMNDKKKRMGELWKTKQN